MTPEKQRCTMRCEFPTVCAPTAEGACACSDPFRPSQCERGRLCWPTTEAGPRGEILNLTIIERQEPCPPSAPCEIRHVLSPGGSITVGNEQMTDRLITVDDPVQLQWELDILRPILVGGPLQCDGPVESPFIRFELRTDRDTYARDFTSCFTAPTPFGEQFLPTIWALKAR